MTLIQNISVPADNDVTVSVQVDPALGLTSLDGEVFWRVYEEAIGVPGFPTQTPPPPLPVIEKSTADGSVTVGSPPTTFHVRIGRVDTANLLRNYVHESTLVDFNGNISTLNCGILTITQTEFGGGSP